MSDQRAEPLFFCATYYQEKMLLQREARRIHYRVFSDSDFGQGGTNHRGDVFQMRLGTLKNSSVGMKYFHTREVNGPNQNKRDTLPVNWLTTF